MAITHFSDGVSEVVAPGIIRSRVEPGGKAGPDGVVHRSPQIGGGCWTQSWALGYREDPWRLLIPDIRMAPNQIWPLHWHDCWTAVVLLDGSLMMGDWLMGPGDTLIAEPGVEYGPLVIGPEGCQLLEIFARDILSPGGYGSEYRDHPTLQYVRGLGNTAFFDRPPALLENGRRQVVPVDSTVGLAKGRLDGNAYWDLGEPSDPQRGAIFDRKLATGAILPAAALADWRATLVLEGTISVGDKPFGPNDLLLIEPDAKMPCIVAGDDGTHLLEFARTSESITR